jgi:hypothetical protein
MNGIIEDDVLFKSCGEICCLGEVENVVTNKKKKKRRGRKRKKGPATLAKMRGFKFGFFLKKGEKRGFAFSFSFANQQSSLLFFSLTTKTIQGKVMLYYD